VLKRVLICFAFGALLMGCAPRSRPIAPESLPKSLSSSKQRDPELDDAIATAKRSLGSFIQRLANPRRAEVFQIQSSFPALDGTPQFLWVGDVTYKNGVFTGTMTTKPPLQTKIHYGDTVSVKKADVTDWMILRSGASEGGYTVDVLLRRAGQPK
jgi:uncharacterized protein YegJ (DUF2314 family)